MNPPRARLPGERVFTLALLAGSVYMLWQAYGISRFESITSAGVFPMVATGVMVLMVALRLPADWRAPPTAGLPGERLPQQFVRQLAPATLVGFTLATALYMLALDYLGFVIASYLFLVVSMRLLGSTRWGLNLLVSALCLGAIYLVFQTAFSVQLPKGSWVQPSLQGWLK